MIRVAICDDERDICDFIEQSLISCSKKWQKPVETEVFYSAENLMDYINKGNRFDVIFMDVRMQPMSGIEFGQILRDKLYDETTKLVYISWDDSFAMDLFKTRPFDFLVKPIKKDTIFRVMEKIDGLLSSSNKVFTYAVSKKVYRIPYADILYFESENRKIHVHTTGGTRTFYGKMGEVHQQLDLNIFWDIHKSYTVNHHHIKMFDLTSVTLSNGQKLNISQSRRKHIRDKQKSVVLGGT